METNFEIKEYYEQPCLFRSCYPSKRSASEKKLYM